MEKTIKDLTDIEIKASLWDIDLEIKNLQRTSQILLNELVNRNNVQPEKVAEVIEEEKEDTK